MQKGVPRAQHDQTSADIIIAGDTFLAATKVDQLQKHVCARKVIKHLALPER